MAAYRIRVSNHHDPFGLRCAMQRSIESREVGAKAQRKCRPLAGPSHKTWTRR